MFVICDKDDVVQDIASEESDLSRGYNFPGHKLWMDIAGDIRIGDTIEAGSLIKNQQIRDEQLVCQQNEKLITQKTRKITIEALKAEGKLPPEFEAL